MPKITIFSYVNYHRQIVALWFKTGIIVIYRYVRGQMNPMDDNTVRRILLLEDDYILLQLYSTVLKSAGYEVTATTTFKAASDLLHRTSFDLCVSDINVGLVDGFHVLNEMDALRRKYGTEILMISGSITVYRNTCEKLKLRYLEKPFTNAELMRQVDVLLKEKAEKAANPPVVVDKSKTVEMDALAPDDVDDSTDVTEDLKDAAVQAVEETDTAKKVAPVEEVKQPEAVEKVTPVETTPQTTPASKTETPSKTDLKSDIPASAGE